MFWVYKVLWNGQLKAILVLKLMWQYYSTEVSLQVISFSQVLSPCEIQLSKVQMAQYKLFQRFLILTSLPRDFCVFSYMMCSPGDTASIWSLSDSSSFLELKYDYTKATLKQSKKKTLSPWRQPSVRACIRVFWQYTKISEGISWEKMLHTVSGKGRGV